MAFRPVNRPDDPYWHAVQGGEESPEAFASFVNPNKATAVRPTDGHAIPVEGLGIASGESFERGDLVRKDGNEDITELTSVTQTVYGVALEDVSGGSALGVNTSIVTLARASFTDTERTQKTVRPQFATTDVNGTAPTSGDVGTQCALSLSAGEWQIDISNTGNQDVEVVRVDTVRGEYVVQFLAAIVQS